MWGCYAWKKQQEYSIDQNFIVGSHMFRGWPLAESNLQVNEGTVNYLTY